MNSTSPLGKVRLVIILICLAIIICIFAYAYLSDQNVDVLSKEEIIENVNNSQNEDVDYTYVSSYLKKLGIGNINSYKMNVVESQLEIDFYKELPDEKSFANNIALLFVEHFYDEIDLSDTEEVTDAALSCMIASLGDPYAYYRDAEEFSEFLDSLKGGDTFVGIGVMIDMQTLEILMVYRESGAEEAGIKSGDVIVEIDGVKSEGVDNEEFINLMQGEADTTVDVTVKRGDDTIKFTVTRKVLVEKTVFYELNDGIGYIQITQFLSSTYGEFVEAVDFCVENGAVGLIFDVRYNPGGLLNSVVSIIDYLTPDAPGRTIASFTQQGQKNSFYTSDNHSVDLPIAVICNEGTASAGELFTAAMRDFGEEGVLDTVIVGITTYGKGVVQNSYTLFDKSGLTYTIGYFNPPSDVNFNGVGVIPDVKVFPSTDHDLYMEVAEKELVKLINKSGKVNYDAAA